MLYSLVNIFIFPFYTVKESDVALATKDRILTEVCKLVISTKARAYEEKKQEQVNPLIGKFNEPVSWNSFPKMCN